jgi:Uma2 family endonuclease
LPEEFDQHGNRIKDELIRGEVVKMPPASYLHDRIKNRINRLLIRYLDANPAVALDSLVELGAQVGAMDTFIPDVTVIQREQPVPYKRIFQGSPEIAIEVVSPSDTEKPLTRKIDAYLRGGSKSVWVVFPETRSVMVHTPGSTRELRADQTIEGPLLPGFTSPVAAFFELT